MNRIETFISKCSYYSDYYESQNFDKNVLAIKQTENRLVRFGFEERLKFICEKSILNNMN